MVLEGPPLEMSKLAISVRGSPVSLGSDEPRMREAGEEFGSKLEPVPDSLVVSMTLLPTGVMGEVVGVFSGELFGVCCLGGEDGDLSSSSVASAWQGGSLSGSKNQLSDLESPSQSSNLSASSSSKSRSRSWPRT